MNWNSWIRQSHRWLSLAFTVLPLVLLLVTGLYLFVLPYATRWRRGQRTLTPGETPPTSGHAA